MGSEGASGVSGVTVHITGFKKFHGVSENPTEKIVTNLKEFMHKKGLPNGLVLGSCNVLETAGVGALAQLHKILESAIVGHDTQSLNDVIWCPRERNLINNDSNFGISDTKHILCYARPKF